MLYLNHTLDEQKRKNKIRDLVYAMSKRKNH